MVTRKATTIAMSYTGKSISAFYFRGTKYEVQSWRDMFIQLISLVYTYHDIDFDKVLTLKGRKRPYFTYNANELRALQKISNTNIFVETNLSANNIVKICFDLLAIFGYSQRDLKIEAY